MADTEIEKTASNADDNNEVQVVETDTPETKSQKVVKWLSSPKAPLVFGVALSAILLFSAAKHFIGPSGHEFVVFDPVKFMNSQRAAASILTTLPNADLAFSLTQVAKQAENVILEEAHGATVLVKQAVVVPRGVPDITDAVLIRFGLPTDVPTITTNPSKISIENIAPTDSSFSASALSEEYRQELDARANSIKSEAQGKEAQQKMLP